MKKYLPVTPRIKTALKDIFGADDLLVGPEELLDYQRDASEVTAVPELAVRARDKEQISKLLVLANQYHFPVTPRGGGTGLAGGCLPCSGGVVLSLSEMNRLRLIDSVNLIAEVEPGVITLTLRQEAEKKGLFYPPDPAGMDKSTVGGNAATCAGGPACVKYGTTKDYVLGLEVVLPTGNIIQTGVKTRKGVVGYDLTHLIVGSEGTLGVITGLTLKLIPKPPAVAGLAAAFPDLPTAMAAVTDVMGRGHLPAAIEFMDYKCLDLMKDLMPFAVPGEKPALLIVETDGPEEQIAKEIDVLGRILREDGAAWLLKAKNEAERERIWDARRRISLRIHDVSALYMSEDVVVPLGRIAALVEALPAIEEKYRMYVYAFGHAGDGNIHLNVTADSKDHQETVDRGIEVLLAEVLRLGGTISGEHGIGKAKQRFLPMELSPESVALQKGIKQLFDPNHILNPDKIFLWNE